MKVLSDGRLYLTPLHVNIKGEVLILGANEE